jgi:hypothetical protein
LQKIIKVAALVVVGMVRLDTLVLQDTPDTLGILEAQVVHLLRVLLVTPEGLVTPGLLVIRDRVVLRVLSAQLDIQVLLGLVRLDTLVILAQETSQAQLVILVLKVHRGLVGQDTPGILVTLVTLV